MGKLKRHNCQNSILFNTISWCTSEDVEKLEEERFRDIMKESAVGIVESILAKM